MRGQDKRSPSVTEEESINSGWALFLLHYNNTGKFKLSSKNVCGWQIYYMLIYLLCSSRFEPCNSSAVCVCVEFYSRHTHLVSMLGSHDGYSSTGWVGRRVVWPPMAERTKGRQDKYFILKNIFWNQLLLNYSNKRTFDKRLRFSLRTVFSLRGVHSNW